MSAVVFLDPAILVCTFVVIQVRHQRMKERYSPVAGLVPSCWVLSPDSQWC